MEIITEYGFIFIALAVVFGLYMTWGIGANDVANAMGTSVGSRAITIKQAILIAAVFEFAGAFLAGGHVTKTIRKGIIDPSSIAGSPEILVFGMLAAGRFRPRIPSSARSSVSRLPASVWMPWPGARSARLLPAGWCRR
jgi:hypothetical protein